MPGNYIETEEGEKALFSYCCQFNEGVSCHPDKHNCEKCGWNPEVARERLLQICFDKGITIPDEILDSM